MPSNMEIKAQVHGDLQLLRRRAAELATEAPILTRQEDMFFRTPRGRLKLRSSDIDLAELIYYERANECGPRPSVYFIAPVVDAAALGAVHLDDVISLGQFVELEVMLGGEAELERGRERCHELMETLGLAEGDLVELSYIDMLKGRVS